MTVHKGSPEQKQLFDAAGVSSGMIELRLRSLGDLFHPLDPTPIPERSLAPEVVDYIMDKIAALDPKTAISIRVYLPEGSDDVGDLVARAIRNHFRTTSERTRQKLRAHFRNGFKMLLPGLVVVVILVLITQFLANLADRPLLDKVALGIGIVIWVTLWRPIETLIYDWRPIRNECRLYQRLAAVDTVHCYIGES
ncbi:MAG: hypothetical protein EA380_07445 [Phycisphaeraceae bacterium]|nr:MAG: hypothetical protein EA380_07445 [Phycisphaeraceae bacterium]